MLLELRVENLLLIERAELRLGPGLNVITGETGAGKTMLAHALDLLLGGRARPGVVRPGAGEAWVEGVFELPAALRDRVPADAGELVLARRVGGDGRTRAYVGGRACSLAGLREAAEQVLAFYGQHEHRRLALAGAQLEILDGFCGPAQRERRAACARAHAAERELTRELEGPGGAPGERERELDLLRFELAEIESAGPSEEEASRLTAERARLRAVEGLRAACLAARESIAAEAGARSALAAGDGALAAVAGLDGDLDRLAERQRALLYEAEDLAAELRRYGEGLDAAPGRLDEVEERLAALARLERRHGGSIAAVLDHARFCRERIALLEGAAAGRARARAALEAARGRVNAVAGELHEARARAAPLLGAAVRERLAELAMEGAGIEIALSRRAEPGPAGADAVEFLIAPNPGVAPGPLRDVASGGETARIMLALLAVAHGGAGDGAGADARLLVLDEVDAGIGGRTARAVGAHLRALARGRRVLCITHLPQIACLAQRHFRIVKDSGREPALATVEGLEGEGVVGELMRMLGADAADDGARRHARELLRAA